MTSLKQIGIDLSTFLDKFFKSVGYLFIKGIFTILVTVSLFCIENDQKKILTDKLGAYGTLVVENAVYFRRTCKIIVPADTAVAPLKKEAFF